MNNLFPPADPLDLTRFVQSIQLFGIKHGLGIYTQRVLDHLAFKARHTAEYEEWIAALQPHCLALNYVVKHERRLATAVLICPLAALNAQVVCVLEIMEPRPGTTGSGGIDHAEIHWPDLDSIAAACQKRDILFTRGGDEHHQTLAIELNDRGQELKFTDNPLLETIKTERLEGIVTDLII